MVRKEGKIPANARVDVDYTGDKPKIDFSYPSDKPWKEAREQNSMGWWSLILLLVIFGSLIYPWDVVDYPVDCEVIPLDYSHIEINCSNFNQKFWFDPNNGILDSAGFSEDYETEYAFQLFGFLIGGFVLFFMLNYLISKALVRWEWWAKRIPEKRAGGKGRRKNYMKFTPENILGNVAIVPNFHNVELDYKTSGDFSDQLIHIKIREYRWNKWKKGKIGKEKVDNLHWYAVFVFKDKPKDGHLEVIFQ